MRKREGVLSKRLLTFYGVGPCFDGGYGRNLEEGRDAERLRRGVDMMDFTETSLSIFLNFDEREKPADMRRIETGR